MRGLRGSQSVRPRRRRDADQERWGRERQAGDRSGGVDAVVPGRGPGGGREASAPPALSISVLSGRADLVSGGSALVAINLPRSDARQVKVMLGRTNVTRDFAIRQGRPLRGPGDRACPRGETCCRRRCAVAGAARITLVNHPSRRTGFLGAAARAMDLRTGSGGQEVRSGGELQVRLHVDQSGKQRVPALRPVEPPSDVAQTKTDQGVTVPFIVRIETGYMDRDQYQISVLYQPGKPWSAVAPQRQFDHKLLILHGASCGVDYETGHRSRDHGRRRGRLRAWQGVHDDVDRARQQRPQLQPRTSGRVAGHGQGAHHQVLRHDSLHDRHRLLRRLAGAAVDRECLPRRLPGDPADLLVSRRVEHRDAVPGLPPAAGVLQEPVEMGIRRRVDADADGRRARADPMASRTPRSQTRHSSTSPSRPTRAPARRAPTATTRRRIPGGVRCTIHDAAINVFGPGAAERSGPRTKRSWATASCGRRSTTSASSTASAL